ncbi:MAG: hypothetical protein KDA48_16510, partial [Amphiplicatus sp.]|nr:hypothetical protein [Amphiplicatus sp.]
IAYCLSKMSLREASESWVRIASALYALGAPVGLSEVIHVNEPDFEAAEAEKRKQAARSKGGHATAKKLSPERRSEIATKAAQKRWANRCRKTKNSSK